MKDKTLESGVHEEIVPESAPHQNSTPENSTSENVPIEDVIPDIDISGNTTPDETTSKTVTIREPYIAGTETREESWPEWVAFDPAGRTAQCR